MQLVINVYHHVVDDSGVNPAKLDQILHLLNQVINQEKHIMATLADVQAAVEAQETVELSVITLLTELKTKLDAAIASNDPAALQSLSDKIAADTKKLSDAVVANTPTA